MVIFGKYAHLLTPADKLRAWAYAGVEDDERTLLIANARWSALLGAEKAAEAGTEGLPFTPIYWYYVDKETTPVMTLWEMNDG